VFCGANDLDVLESRYIHVLRPSQNGVLKNKSMRAPISLRSLKQIDRREAEQSRMRMHWQKMSRHWQSHPEILAELHSSIAVADVEVESCLVEI
jgi:hypothetical protein